MDAKLKKKLDLAREFLKTALVDGWEIGYSFKIGKMTYQPDGNFKVTLSAELNGNKTEDQKFYEVNQKMLKLPDYGTKIDLGEKGVFSICGINRTGSRVMITDGKGKIFTMTTAQVRLHSKITVDL